MNHSITMSRLNCALSNIDSAYAIIAKEYGLTFNALMIIYLMEASDTVTQKQICDGLHLPKSTVHSIINEFIKQGFVDLEEGNNRKEKHIVTTAAGKAYFSHICDGTKHIEKQVLDALGDEACDLLVQMVETLGILMHKAIEEAYGSEGCA